MNNYTRNTDHHFWEKEQRHSNCGSFALNVQEWVYPDDEESLEDREDVMYDVWDATMNEDETANALAERDWEAILRMFSFLQPIPHPLAVPVDREVIAYRVGIRYDEGEDFLDEDFHFRVRRNGVWYEKCGTMRPHECFCQLVDGEWATPNGDLVYNSRTYYAVIN